MLSIIRKYQRPFSLFTLMVFGFTFIPTNSSFALSSGPSQPETQQFAPAGMDNMVDPFSGDFSYNIPLMDVGGYPININYSAGITPDAEASWTGLGWNLNVGSINRTLRGIPDEFDGDKGDTIYTLNSVEPNITAGADYEDGKTKKFKNINPFKDSEIWGIETSITTSDKYSLSYNNYTGIGVSYGMGSAAFFNKVKNIFNTSLGLDAALSSGEGFSLVPKIGLGYNNIVNSSVSMPYNSLSGLKGYSFGLDFCIPSKKLPSNWSQFAGGTFHGYAWPTFTPTIQNSTYTVDVKFGFQDDDSLDVTIESYKKFSGFYRSEYQNTNYLITPAYGYKNLAKAVRNEYGIMDFNREKESLINEFSVNIGLANHTQDIFIVSGQGVAGTYRLYRSDIGLVRDPLKTVTGGSGTGVPEFGSKETDTKFGANAGYISQYSVSKGWLDPNFDKYLGSLDVNYLDEIKATLNSKSEISYFKKVGDLKAESKPDFYKKSVKGATLNSYAMISDQIIPFKFDYDPTSLAVLPTSGVIQPQYYSNQAELANRAYRSESFTALSVAEAEKAELTTIDNIKTNSFDIKTPTSTSKVGYEVDESQEGKALRKPNGVKDHHFSEMRVTDANGNRYVYGLPVYNTEQKDVSFSVEGDLNNVYKPFDKNLIKYTDKDASEQNDNGISHTYHVDKMPVYAHSFLLTCVLSADYVDSDGIKGPSDGDLGTYTKFNYTRITTNYNWRTPLTNNKEANLSENLLSKKLDDIASYSYGTKEIWYLHSIETRTHVAEFILNEDNKVNARKDGLGVISETNPTCGGAKLRYLDKIKLYSKADKLNKYAKPIKVVHFTYNYSLCPNTPNSTAEVTKGKLTLQSIHFTYGNSNKGVLNPYVFKYAQVNKFEAETNENKNQLNPGYSVKITDRWGFYKIDGINGVKNSFFPYVNQEDGLLGYKAHQLADRSAAVYSLSTIHTPTGGTIHVYYESDDYAYVQDKRAMKMMKIKSFASESQVLNNSFGLNNNLLYDGPNIYNCMLVDITEIKTDLDNCVDNQQRNNLFLAKYLEGVENLYYKVRLNIVNNINPLEEFIPGYAKINLSKCKVVNRDGRYYGVIGMDEVQMSSGAGIPVTTHPISKNGWMFARQHFNKEVMESSDPNAKNLPGFSQVYELGTKLVAMGVNLINVFTGYPQFMQIKNHSNRVNLDFAFVRLDVPNYIKYGGGHRVKAILMSDNWTELTGKTVKTAYYGQRYDYKIDKTITINGVTQTLKISSGVASYEPIMGGEENPFRQPVYITETKKLAPSLEQFQEEPFGESQFPSPSVGYSKVIITPLKIELANNVLPFKDDFDKQDSPLVGNGTGKVVHTFKTAKDFPTIAKRTILFKKRVSSNSNLALASSEIDMVTATQGFYIELNDMHGKPESQTVLADDGKTIVSAVSYKYKTDEIKKKLVSKVSVIDNDFTILKDTDPNAVEMGVEIDVANDVCYHSDEMAGGGADLNIKNSRPGTFIIFAFVPVPNSTYNYNRVRTASLTKVVNRHAILESTTATQHGSTITTTNLAWDRKTGEVLLTSTANEYNDPVYNFTIPAYWAYEKAQHAANNEGATFTDIVQAASNGVITDGDELVINDKSGLYYVDKTSDGTFKIIDVKGDELAMGKVTKTITLGQPLNFTFSFQFDRVAKIVRSGYRNIPSMPVGTIVMLANPIPDSGNKLVFNNILNTGATEMKEIWDRFCNCEDQDGYRNFNIYRYQYQIDASTNPFILGTKGNLRPFKSYTYLTDRKQSTRNNNVNVRTDGVFTGKFVPFWVKDNGSPFLQPSGASSYRTPWQYVTEITKYNPIGMEVENRDALNRYSMAQFGYGMKLPVATSNNSKYSDSGFDGFEDYDTGCLDEHFSWRKTAYSNLSDKYVHTGRKSIKVVGGGVNLKISKTVSPCIQQSTQP